MRSDIAVEVVVSHLRLCSVVDDAKEAADDDRASR
jgi:hypothetical protein